MTALPLAQTLDAIQHRRSAALSGLAGSSAPFLLAALAPTLPGPVLWITEDEASARRRRSELQTFLGPAEPVHLLPAWDVAPYGGFSPSAETTRARLATLDALNRGARYVVAPIDAVLKRVLPPDVLRRDTRTLRVGDDLDRDSFLKHLVERGFLATDLCADPGTFAVRGGILDLFAPGWDGPARLEFWGDEIESIRRFDPWTQRSVESLDEATVLPAREEVLGESARVALPAALKAIADERGLPPKARIALQNELEEARVLQELELFLPLLQPRLGTVFDYLGPGGLAVIDGAGAVEGQLLGELDRMHARWSANKGHDRLVPDPTALFLDEEALAAALPPTLHLHELHPEGAIRCDVQDLGALRTDILARKGDRMLQPLADRVKALWADGARAAVLGPRARLQQLVPLLSGYELPLSELDDPSAPALSAWDSELTAGRLALIPADLHRGFALPDLAIFALEEILGPRSRTRRATRPKGHEAIGDTAQLARGDLVVHALHGIGRFEGLQKLQLDAGAMDLIAARRERAEDPDYKPGSGGALGAGRGSNNDFLLLRYRGGDKLYLPVHKLNLLAKFVSPGGAPPSLDKLGGQTWATRKKKVSEDVQRVARELLELHAKRKVAAAYAFGAPDSFFDEFVSAFPYTETPDQQDAIDAVVRDMTSPEPMDRLVVGDVGFGKTEVALRGTFLAVEHGKQVAVLVPTTILALQHFEAFKERLDAFPVRVEMLSRFRSPAEQRKTLKDLKNGRVDVVVGTHRLLSKDVVFQDLGLLVVDEEHRFGVKHKERIKELRAGVDVLTLTATPIPRTLHMALSGIREFSVIATPPQGREPVRTAVARFSPARIGDSIRAEVERGGQVYFLHNRVKTIWRMRDFLHKMLPDVRIRVAHGQMNEGQLEDIMLAFFHGDFDLLLSTTIIESGLDVPRANTIILNRADRLGLAQLHQLRGRVGRGLKRGFALLLVPPGRALSSAALERLRVIQDNAQLGAGHRIAQHDLELRGAGNLLGRKQSGHMASVGMATYMEMLEAAVQGLQGKAVTTDFEPEVELRTDAFIPGDYIPDERDRLLEYKRLCDARTTGELRDLLDELEDRYGHAPDEVKRFERLIELKVLCRELRVQGLRVVRGGRLEVRFDPTTPVDPAALMAWVAGDARRLSFRPEGVLHVSLDPEERRDPLESARTVLDRLRASPPDQLRA